MGTWDDGSYEVIGAAMEVHRKLGCGFLEAAYQEALAIELELRGIAFEREFPIVIDYKGRRLRSEYRGDFLVEGRLIVELKAQSGLYSTEVAQVINYLNATHHPAGLLTNFGAPSLEVRRLTLRKGFPVIPEIPGKPLLLEKEEGGGA